MKSFLLILSYFLLSVCFAQERQHQFVQHKALKLIEQNKEDLIDVNNIKEDSADYMLLQKLKTSDTIILVCFFEDLYTPHFKNTISGKKYTGAFTKDKYGRVVQVLKGNIQVGEVFVLRESYTEMPIVYPYTREDIMQGKITQPVSFPLKGEMSYVVFCIEDTQRENGTIIHENQHVNSEYRCLSDFHVSLSRFLKVKPAAIERQAF